MNEAIPAAGRAARQRLLVLYLGNASPDSPVIAWANYDGTGRPVDEAGECEKPPYPTALAAMRDGWRIVGFPPIHEPLPGREYETGHLHNEFILERLETVDVA